MAIALGTIATPATLEPLLQLSRDDVPQVRAAAAVALGKLGDDRARKRRGELMTDPDPGVRAGAGAVK